MSVLQRVFGLLSALQLVALFGVLILRRHYQRMPLFTFYVGGLTLSNAVYALHSTWETWMLHQVVTAALRFGVALELTRCIFGAFPAAAVTARRVMLLILVFTAVTAVTAAPPDAVYTRMHAESIPRMASAAIWMLTALAGLVLWYRLPLAPLPRAILMGYAPYLLVFTIAMSLLFHAGSPNIRALVGYVDPFAFFVLVNYWFRVAWRTVPESPPLPTSGPTATPAPVPQQAAP